MRLFRKAYAGHPMPRLHASNGRLTRFGIGLLNAGDRAGRMGIVAITSCRTGIATLRSHLISARGNAVKFQRSSAEAVNELSGGMKKSARIMKKSAKVMQKSVRKARKEFK